MSGPWSDGVRQLKFQLEELSGYRSQISRLTSEIEDRQQKLAQAQENLRSTQRAIDNLMMQMDVKAAGNAGYEQRRMELLLMLVELS